ncbi:hypothetical protein ACFY36_51295 [Actinoplanes sp. NPDC000266]
MASSPPVPNELFRAARLRLKSAYGDGPMPREEFADRVNSIMDPRDQDGPVSGADIGKIERGIVSYPRKYRREAYRKLLNVATDAEIGLINRRTRTAETLPAAETLSSAGTTAGHHTETNALNEPARVHAGEHLDLDVSAAASIGIAAPALTLDDLDRIQAVARDARRYLDETLVEFLDEQLARCAIDDGLHGPRYALPGALGIVSIVQRDARTVRWAVRQPLLRVGARAAEFTGWLYRDAGHPAAADYWRDRACEWAMEATDYAMPGYILIKKSQSAWDARDAGRMLGLAEAVQAGPWRLPTRIMAEAVQQQARGLAMRGASRATVDDTLKRARDLLEQEPADHVRLAAHYDAALFKVQTAICYGESGRPEEAAEIYQSTLKPALFSTRDNAYFAALQAQSLAAAKRPDDAASVGTATVPRAMAAGSTRTLRELARLSIALRPWQQRPPVQSFRRLMHAL